MVSSSDLWLRQYQNQRVDLFLFLKTSGTGIYVVDYSFKLSSCIWVFVHSTPCPPFSSIFTFHWSSFKHPVILLLLVIHNGSLHTAFSWGVVLLSGPSKTTSILAFHSSEVWACCFSQIYFGKGKSIHIFANFSYFFIKLIKNCQSLLFGKLFLCFIFIFLTQPRVVIIYLHLYPNLPTNGNR